MSDGDPSEYELEAQVGHLLRRAYQRHLSLFQGIMGEDGPTSMQFAALVTLAQRGPLSQNLLGRMLAMDPPTVKGVVARLMARGLVVRQKDPTDARLLLVALTPAAEAALPGWVAKARAITAATLAPLSAADAARLARLLRNLT
ncbi:MarR family transcriptional regulator [Siccirubricoccus sp. KC 17139]|uniref:MarR family transcriptional regulator n=1 Tax=Siccirubricoccus soli TaxID=2899147 RepID=A0ABT1D1F5_9PROT|nr:MarR family transcriptional regulator [Siccirubricoccus soli]MCO6415743.1 MarR family transcriptional regulator [Siccirubricoccus soli]MCP2681875.1 MarR family transcriptional regulator [Siccirubricoccus soli]